MKPEQIIKAWKNQAYRKSLTEDERAALPPNPAGLIELSDAQLEAISGAADSPITHQKSCTDITKNNSTICQITNKCTDITKGCTVYYPVIY